MASDDVWPVIDAERKALVADLDGLGDAGWETPSLCRDWTVRDVVAHLTATSKLSGPAFLVKFASSGFRITRLQEKDIAVERGRTPVETLARFKERLDSRGRPPGPIDTMLGEVIVHAEDIRRPLGLTHSPPTEACARVAQFYARSNLILGGKRRVSGLTLRATDMDWSHGDGPLVTGSIIDLVMAITGRRAVLDRLSGEGVDTLRARS